MSADVPASVVTIGNLDGVHLGHRALVARTVELAHAAGLRAVALTFDPHPAALLRPEAVPLRLQPLRERIAALRALGIDHVEVAAFDAELAALEPDAFVDRVLVERLGARHVVVGDNFRFGKGARGDVALLEALGRERGFTVDRVDLVALAPAAGSDGADEDTRAVSSTLVRAAIADGDVERAAALLGRPHALTGEVVAGDGRGRTIGIPTANVAVLEGLALPADGVYAGRARVDDEPGPGSPCVVNVGWRPTFDGRTRTVEAHLLDTERDLYGHRLTVAFLHRLRGEERFAGPEALVARIRQDVARARELLGA